MKCVLLSVRPQWVAKILNGEKTIEVRKKFPANYRGWVYIYCTKDQYLYRTNKGYIASKKPLKVGKGTEYTFAYSDEGKVVARFWCDKVEEINNRYCRGMLIDSCLTNNELNDYLGNYQGYAIHITKLEIFDEPKEISEFRYYKKFSEIDYMLPIPKRETCERLVALTKAPQSFMYVEIEGN